MDLDGGNRADERLVRLADWMDAYGTDVLNVAYSYVKNYHAAQDISQDVFLRAFTKMDSFRGDSGVKTWLLSITANRCKDFLRSWVVRHETDELSEHHDSLTNAVEDTEGEVLVRLERDALWRQVERLPLKYREVTVLFYRRDMSSAQVAETLGISEATVRTRLHRARSLLRQWMEGEEGE